MSRQRCRRTLLEGLSSAFSLVGFRVFGQDPEATAGAPAVQPIWNCILARRFVGALQACVRSMPQGVCRARKVFCCKSAHMTVYGLVPTGIAAD
jgi:hypothetical protein